MLEIHSVQKIARRVGRRVGLERPPDIQIRPILVRILERFFQIDRPESRGHLCRGLNDRQGRAEILPPQQIGVKGGKKEIFDILFTRIVTLNLEIVDPTVPASGRQRQSGRRLRIIRDQYPGLGCFPRRVCGNELLGVFIGIEPAHPSSRLAEKRRRTRQLVVQARPKAGMQLLRLGQPQVDVECVKGLAVGQPGFGLPTAQRAHCFGQRVRDDLVLDRPEQHAANRDHKGDQDKNQQRRNKRQRPQLLAAQCPRQTALERRSIGGSHHSRLIGHSAPSTTRMTLSAVRCRIFITSWYSGSL